MWTNRGGILLKEIIIGEEGSFEIPEKYQNEKRLVIREAWTCRVIWKANRNKGRFLDSIQFYMRSESNGDKPYVPEGFMEINGERFKIIDNSKGSG